MSRLGQADLNLIPALWALLTERNVSRAARRLGVSQPAASSALARLRRQYDDQLLVRQGQTYVLTPLAEHLLPLATEAIVSADALTGSRLDFDPATSTREFVITATDYGQQVIGPMLAARAAVEAPHVRFSYRWPFTFGGTTRETLLAEVDGWIAPRELMNDLPFSGLLADRWVCVVAQDHPGIGDELTLADVSSHPWVLPTIPSRGLLPQLRQLFALGITLDVATTTDTFGAIPALVAGSPRLGLVQERFARLLAPALGLRVLTCPWPMAAVNFTLWWRPDLQRNAGHTWFRHFFERTVGEATITTADAGYQ